MFYVEARLVAPENESLWYEFEELDDAIDYAKELVKRVGIASCLVIDEDDTEIDLLEKPVGDD